LFTERKCKKLWWLEDNYEPIFDKYSKCIEKRKQVIAFRPAQQRKKIPSYKRALKEIYNGWWG